MDVMEIYSPKRFMGEAARFGLKPGYAIEEVKSNGTYWDLSKPEDVEDAPIQPFAEHQ